ncbi:sugar ABC transporter substrate-binding protein [Kitasatospora sp. NPDC052896]|uniref:sugar ABC transporter substrate-binding protein n=1 Tax=Kitasatospora sp. NPDC052896 TaxID=3364061 RepID=UPI0037CC3529
MKSYLGRSAVAATVLSLAAGLAACGATVDTAGSGGGAPGRGGFTVGLLLPDTHTARWGTADRPLIEQRVKQLCDGCTVRYANASADVATQQQQVDSMIANGVRALIIDPVDHKAMRSSIVAAYKAHVPVISYDRLADGPVSAYSSFDSEQIGRLQAEALVTAMGPKAPESQIVMMNGDPTDPNTSALQKGALSVLKGKVKIGRSYYTAGWIPENAFSNMSAAIAQLGANRIDGVYSANDGLATGVLAALKAANIKPLPPVTGQDADLAAVQRIVRGEQYVTVYKSFASEANAAAEMAVALGRGQSLSGIATTTVANDTRNDIPAVLGTPVPVTLGTIRSAVVDNGPYTIDQICTPKLAPDCQRAGLTTA